MQFLVLFQYEFVTPLTSLVVVKPNATNAVNTESVDSQRKFIPFKCAQKCYIHENKLIQILVA